MFKKITAFLVSMFLTLSFTLKRASTFETLFEKLLAGMTKDETKNLMYLFIPFIFGIYPMTNATQKQTEAMKTAGIDFDTKTAYELAYKFLLKII